MKLEKHFRDKDRLVAIVGGHHNDLINFETYHEELTKELATGEDQEGIVNAGN